MSRIKLISVSPPGASIELDEGDDASTFEQADNLRASLVDVVRDNKYVLSLMRMGGEDTYWTIFQRYNLTLRRLGNADDWRGGHGET